MKIIAFRVLFFYLLALTSNIEAKSPIPTCNLKPLSSSEKSVYEEKIRKNATYGEILNLKPSRAEVSISRCNQVNGNVHASYIVFNDIFGKKCSINSINFPFHIQNDEIKFRKILPKKLRGFTFDRLFLKAAFKKVMTSTLIRSFFKVSNFCQIEYNASPSNPYWFVQLRSNNGKYCFIQSSLDGGHVQIIPRLYAKPSDCNQAKIIE